MNPDPPKKRRRWAKVLLWMLGALILLLSASWIILNAVGSSNLEEALAAVRAAGFSTSLAELASPPLPAEENAAPLFAAAFALHPDPDGKSEALKRAQEDGFFGLSPEEKLEVRDLLEKSSELFSKIRAGRQLGACRYDRDYSKGLLTDLPEITQVLRTARLLWLRAESETEAGRPSETRESVRDMFSLAEGYRGEPMLIGQLIRMAVIELARETIDKCVASETPEADLRAWLDIVPAPEIIQGAADLAMRGELAGVSQVAGRPFHDPNIGRAEMAIFSPFWKIMGARYLRSMSQLIQSSRKPYLEARRETTEYVEALRVNNNKFDMLSILMIPAVGKTLDQEMRIRASLTVTRTGLQAEITRAVTGRYPETIDVIDPFTGKPLPYSKEAGSITCAHPSLGDEPPTWKLRRK